jgi:DNA-binding transcriptional regulator GbsR (MarR family)
MGDRRDHFAARGDTWEMLVTIFEERKRREIEPTLSVLRQFVRDMETERETPDEVRARIKNMLSFLTNLTGWFDQIVQLPKVTLVALMKLGAKVGSFVKSAKGA